MRMKKNVLSWFGHVEQISDERMVKKIYDGKVSGKIGRGRPWLTFENTVLKTTGGRSRKTHEDSTEGMYEEVDDSGRGERGI